MLEVIGFNSSTYTVRGDSEAHSWAEAQSKLMRDLQVFVVQSQGDGIEAVYFKGQKFVPAQEASQQPGFGSRITIIPSVVPPDVSGKEASGEQD